MNAIERAAPCERNAIAMRTHLALPEQCQSIANDEQMIEGKRATNKP